MLTHATSTSTLTHVMHIITSTTLETDTMQDKTHNGWTNYATWLVNLEMFSAVNPCEHGWIKNGEADSYGLSLTLKDYLEEYIYETTSEGIARDCALAFAHCFQ